MKYSIALLITGALFFYAGCNSSTYEIVEVEETVEIKEELKYPEADIVPEIKEDTNQPENKLSSNQVISRNYVVQIGAFSDEINAGKFTNTAKENLASEEIYYKDIDGLFKVRLGNFSSRTDAMAKMQMLKELGYTDSFVVELTYMKIENK
jgi:cell division septation protein DedD